MKLHPPGLEGFDTGRLERIIPVFQQYVDQGIFAGFSLEIARNGNVIFQQQIGFTDLESELPIQADTLFRIYSMTKPITATAIMILHEEGKFQLSDPISKYISAFDKMSVLEVDSSGIERIEDPIRIPTIKDLLTHTAGFTYDHSSINPVGNLYRKAGFLDNPHLSLKDFVHELSQIPLANQPGKNFNYGLSLDIVAYLVEILGDQPFNEFLQERIFSPLQLNNISFFVSPEKRPNVATMYADKNNLPYHAAASAGKSSNSHDIIQINPSNRSPIDIYGFARGGHGLVSTVNDYTRFAQMLLNRGKLENCRILSPKTVDYMHVNHLPKRLLPLRMSDNSGRPGYGFGLGSRVLINPAESPVIGSLGEFGWAGIARTYYFVDPKEQLIGVIMAQKFNAAEQPQRDFQTLVYQALID